MRIHCTDNHLNNDSLKFDKLTMFRVLLHMDTLKYVLQLDHLMLEFILYVYLKTSFGLIVFICNNYNVIANVYLFR